MLKLQQQRYRITARIVAICGTSSAYVYRGPEDRKSNNPSDEGSVHLWCFICLFFGLLICLD